MAARKKIEKKARAYVNPIKVSRAARRQRRRLLAKPVRSIVLRKGMKASALVDAMAGMSIQARKVGSAAQVLKAMFTDKTRQTVLLGLAGPLIAAGLRDVILKLITEGYVDVLVSTGAILYQDIYQARGHKHYVGSPDAPDTILRDLCIDRIHDTFVDDEAFWEVDTWCARAADQLAPGNYSSRAYLRHVGSLLTDRNSIVRACYRHGVPVFCPAINDSSIGIGLTEHRHRCVSQGTPGIAIDSIADNYELTQVVSRSPATSAIYVAGGVPKNYINDSVVMSYILGENRGHDYAVQMTTAVVEDGGLSGSTLGEAQSWGKIGKRAKFAKAWIEPSVSLPLLATYILDECPTWRERGRLQLRWDGQILKELRVVGKGK